MRLWLFHLRAPGTVLGSQLLQLLLKTSLLIRGEHGEDLVAQCMRCLRVARASDRMLLRVLTEDVLHLLLLLRRKADGR